MKGRLTKWMREIMKSPKSLHWPWDGLSLGLHAQNPRAGYWPRPGVRTDQLACFRLYPSSVKFVS